MKYKKTIILLVLAIFIFGVASVCASDVNDTAIAREDDSIVELSQADADEIMLTDENELISQTDNGLISEGNSGSFAELQINITQATEGSTLTLNKNYECEDGFDSGGILINKSITIDGQGNKIDAQGKSRIFKITAENVILKNIIFTNGKTTDGGAVYFSGTGEVTNCNFTNNTASGDGGAVYFWDQGTVTNCNFVDNSASHGGAIFSMEWYTTADTCIFKNSGDNVNTVIYLPTLNVNNFTTVYGSGEKLTFDLKTNSSIPVTNGNISISVYFKDNGEWVRNYTCLSGEGWIPDLPVGSYIAVFNTEYAKFQMINRTIRIIPNIKFYANVTSAETNNRTVNITAKSNIPQDILEGKLLFIFSFISIFLSILDNIDKTLF